MSADRFRMRGGSSTRPAVARRRIEVVFLEGTPYAQFFATRPEPVACFDAMAAPGNVLVSADGPRWAPSRMRFEIRVR